MSTLSKDFEYYQNLQDLVANALLHLLCHVSTTQRFVTTAQRNEILIRFLKPKLKNKSLSNIKKDIKLLLQTARTKGSNLEMKLYELNEKACQTMVGDTDKLYSLLVHIEREEGVESRLFNEGIEPEQGVLYVLEDHIEHCFDDNDKQIAPLSLLIQHERAPSLADSINRHGQFRAEIQEWNTDTQQAHILAHPV